MCCVYHNLLNISPSIDYLPIYLYLISCARQVPFVVLADSSVGGSWNAMDGRMNSLSPADWMQLPGCVAHSVGTLALSPVTCALTTRVRSYTYLEWLRETHGAQMGAEDVEREMWRPPRSRVLRYFQAFAQRFALDSAGRMRTGVRVTTVEPIEKASGKEAAEAEAGARWRVTAHTVYDTLLLSGVGCHAYRSRGQEHGGRGRGGEHHVPRTQRCARKRHVQPSASPRRRGVPLPAPPIESHLWPPPLAGQGEGLPFVRHRSSHEGYAGKVVFVIGSGLSAADCIAFALQEVGGSGTNERGCAV